MPPDTSFSVAGTMTQLDGQAGIVVPTIRGWIGLNAGFTANRAFASRFTLLNDRTITQIKFRTNTAGTGNVDVGIYDANGNRLASAGSTASKKGATTWQTVSLSAAVTLTAGTVYYAVLISDVTDGTYNAVFWNSSSGQAMDQMWGATFGLAQSFLKDTTFPLAASIASWTVNAAVGPIVGLV